MNILDLTKVTINKLYCVSDTHLEHKDRPIEIHTSSPELSEAIALIGDIGWIKEESYWNFIRRCASMYQIVFIILGNHEHYFHEIHELPCEVSKCLHDRYLPNVYLLQNQSIEFANCIVWGSTLWSKVSMNAFIQMNDSRVIKDKSSNTGVLRMGTVYEYHNKAVANLEQTMDFATKKQKPLIVLTHHAPLMEMNDDYINSSTASGYATDLSYLFKAPILTWICGHTHRNVSIIKNNIRCYANCYGYPGEYMPHPYNSEDCLYIPKVI